MTCGRRPVLDPRSTAGRIGAFSDARRRRVPAGVRMSTRTWEYLVVALEDARKLEKDSGAFAPGYLDALGAQGWEAVGLTLKHGDLAAWPVVRSARTPSGGDGRHARRIGPVVTEPRARPRRARA
jgi:hypothetical protein